MRFHHPPFRIVPGLLAVALAAGCGGSDGTGPGGGSEDPIATVVVTPATATLAVGDTRTFTATASTAAGETVSTSFTWTSQDDDVATVTTTGVVTAEGPGGTLIEAEAEGVTGTAVVAVLAAPPEAPTGLEVVSSSSNRITLTWTDNSSEETGFEVQRSLEAASGFQAVGSTGVDVTEFADGSVQPETTYYYRVRALGEGEPSGFSEVVEVTTPVALEQTVETIQDVVDGILPPPGTPEDGRDRGAELETLAPALAALPQVATVLVHGEAATAQAVLLDGTSVLIINNRQPSEDELTQEAAGVRRRADSLRYAAAVPGATRAVAVAIDGGEGVAADIRQLLSDGGYDVVPMGGSVEDMRQYRDLGVLYLDTHGASFYPVAGVKVDEDGEATGLDFGPDPEKKYAVQTTTEIATEDLAQYQEELERGDLAIALGEDFFGRDNRVAKLAITESFIERYWGLEDGIVILHTCFGGSGPFTASGTCFGACALGSEVYYDATPVREAILNAGADVIQAFDNYIWATSSRPSMEYFLDRVIGVNSVEPTADPERRPFNLARVRASMAQRGLLTHPKGGRTVNTVFTTDIADSEIIGAPSVERVEVIDDADQGQGVLELAGTFGNELGRVKVGGQQVSLSAWTDHEIVARTPFQGPGAVGDLVVESPSGLESNEVPITEWRGGITVTFDPPNGSLLAKAEIDAKFRADVHASRSEVEGEPEEPTPVSYFSPATFGRVTGSGSYTDEGGTVTFLGSEEPRILGKAEVDAGGILSTTESVFGGKITLDPEAGTALVCFSLYGKIRVRTDPVDGPTQETDAVLVLVPFTLFDSLDGTMGCLQLTLDSSYGISGGKRTFSEDGTIITLEWTTFQASSPPDGDTKG